MIDKKHTRLLKNYNLKVLKDQQILQKMIED